MLFASKPGESRRDERICPQARSASTCGPPESFGEYLKKGVSGQNPPTPSPAHLKKLVLPRAKRWGAVAISARPNSIRKHCDRQYVLVCVMCALGLAMANKPSDEDQGATAVAIFALVCVCVCVSHAFSDNSVQETFITANINLHKIHRTTKKSFA